MAVGAAGVGGVGLLVARGALTLDFGVGRRTRLLGPIELRIAAPPDVVFDVIEGPYRRTPRAMADKLRVWERGGDIVVAEHFTKLGPVKASTLEVVRFERPVRITFRLVRGPFPHVVESYELRGVDGETRFVYSGELGADFWALGGPLGQSGGADMGAGGGGFAGPCGERGGAACGAEASGFAVTGWDRAARLYDFQVILERTAIDQALELAAIGAGDRLLDLGTGTGAVLARLAARADAPREAVGVDRLASMLAAAGGLPLAWRLLHADATALPFPNESFDVVTAAYLLHLLEPPVRRAVIIEAARVLRARRAPDHGHGRRAAVACARVGVRARGGDRAADPWHHGGIARAGSTP